jgi:hypothetical protein
MPIDTITIGAGQSAWLPRGAKILSVDATNSLTLSSPSNCIDTTVEAKRCFKLSYTYTEDDATTGAWDAGDGNNKIIGMFINGVEQPCDFQIVSGLTNATNFLSSQSQGSISNVAFTLDNGDPSDKDTVNITFKAPEKIGNDVYFRFQITQASGDPLTNIRVYAEEVECDNPV